MTRQNRWRMVTLLLLLVGVMSSLRAVGATLPIVDGVWEISSQEDLYAFAEYVNADNANAGANAKLMNDIVVNDGTVFTDNNYTLKTSGLTQWTPISRYSGTFDGQGHTISGLYCEDGYRSGFVREVNGGSITNLGIVNSYFRGHETAAGIACSVIENSKVSSCWVKDSHLVAYCDQSSIETPEQIFVLAGIVGRNNANEESGPSLDNCFFIGKLTGGDGRNIDSASIGGIVGESFKTVNNCYAIASVSMNDHVSHASNVGQILGRARTLTPYTNCYAMDTTIGNLSEIQGAAPSFEEPVVSVRTESDFASGVVAYLLNGSVSGKTDGWRQRIEGKDNQKDTYPVLQPTANNIIYYKAGTGTYSNIPVEFVANWEISTAQDLYDYAECVNAYPTSEINAKLMNDIVVNAQVFKDDNYTLVDNVSELTPWTPINGSIGTFDGQGHTISGLYCDQDGQSNCGFFGNMQGGTIKNLGIINSCFKGYLRVGTFAGFHNGSDNVSFNRCWGYNNLIYADNSQNKMWTQSFVGGIIGHFYGNTNAVTKIADCSFVGKMQTNGSHLADIIAGGIVGSTYYTIRNCYTDVLFDIAKPSVAGSFNQFYKGRLIGNSECAGAPYTNCYATVQGSVDKNDYMLCRYRVGVVEHEYPNPAGSVRTKEEFASGIVTYLLNGSVSGKEDGWRQRIDGEDSQKDAYPVLCTTENNIVFAGMAECPDNEIVLSNSEVTPKTHSYQVDNAPSGKVSLPLFEMHCENGGCGKEKPNTLVVKLWDGTDNLELEYALAEEKTDEREICAITINSENKHCVFKTATDDLTINSDKPYYSPVDFLVPGTLTFSRSFVPNTGCYTMFLPFKLTASEHIDLGSFYTCSGLKYKSDNNYNLDFNAISNSNDIAAHTGCLFLPKEANGTVPGIIVTDKVVKASTGISNPNSTSGKTNCTMYGTYQLTDIPTHVFGYYEKDGKAVFALGGSGAKLKQFRAYLYLKDYASSAKEIPVLFFDEVATGVNEILARPLYDANSPVYDLFGRRVVNPQRGSIYIQNGMKFKM